MNWVGRGRYWEKRHRLNFFIVNIRLDNLIERFDGGTYLIQNSN